MGFSASRPACADATVTNISGNNYVNAVQASAQTALLYSLTVCVLNAADRFLWLFDVAAGTTSSTGPVLVLPCPAGLTSVLEYSSGVPFANGIYAVVSTANPTAANVSPLATIGASNDAIVTIGLRKM